LLRWGLFLLAAAYLMLLLPRLAARHAVLASATFGFVDIYCAFCLDDEFGHLGSIDAADCADCCWVIFY
jgi:hypothetical protein